MHFDPITSKGPDDLYKEKFDIIINQLPMLLISEIE